MDQHNDIAEFVPQALNHILGQKSVTDQVAVALEAAWADGRKAESALLVGPPGCGKSALASVYAKEMAADFHEVLSQSVECLADLNAILLRAKDKDVVFFEEAHLLSGDIQTALYLAIDKKTIFVPGSKSVQGIPIADHTLLLATTHEFSIQEPLRDRCRLILRFQHYSPEDLTEILKHRVRGLRWEVDDEVLPMIAARSKGTPRLALRLLQSCRRVARAEGKWRITANYFDKACQLESIDSLGLGPIEKQYLQIVALKPTRLNVLASLLALPSRTISEVTEPILIRLGLLTKDNQGRRCLTAKGHEHLSQSSEDRG